MQRKSILYLVLNPSPEIEFFIEPIVLQSRMVLGTKELHVFTCLVLGKVKLLIIPISKIVVYMVTHSARHKFIEIVRNPPINHFIHQM